MKIIQKYKIYLVKLVEEIVVDDIENKWSMNKFEGKKNRS